MIRASHRVAPASRPRSTPAPLDPTLGLMTRPARPRRTNSGRSIRCPAGSSVRRPPRTRVHGTARRKRRRSDGAKRGASSGRPRTSRSPLWLNSPATPGRIRRHRSGRGSCQAPDPRGSRDPRSLGRDKRCRRACPEAEHRLDHAGARWRSPARRGSRPRGTLPLGAGPRCSRQRGRHPPRRPPREGGGAPGAARQPGPTARRAPGGRAGRRAHAPRVRCRRAERPPSAGYGRLRHGCKALRAL